MLPNSIIRMEVCMLQINDILNIGPYLYKVKDIKGNMTLFSWINKDGVEQEMWVIMRKTSKSIKEAA